MVTWLPQPPERSYLVSVGESPPTDTGSLLFDIDELERLEASANRIASKGIAGNTDHKGWLIVRPLNGLCNRLRAILSGLILAKDLGRNLVIDWQLSDACNCDWSRLFEPIPGVVFDGRRIAKENVALSSAFELIDLWFRTLSFVGQSIGGVHMEQYVQVHLDYHRKGLAYFLDTQAEEWTHLSRFCKTETDCGVLPLPTFMQVDCLIVAAFEEFYPPRSQERVAAVTERSQQLKLLRPARNIADRLWQLPPNTLSVHVRRTDHQAACRRSPIELVLKEVELVLQRLRTSTRHANLGAKASSGRIAEYAIFLATDDHAVEEEFRKRYGPRLLLHRKRTLDRRLPEGIEDALVDLLLLSRGSELVGSFESSFSDVAALFHQLPLHVVDNGDIGDTQLLCHHRGSPPTSWFTNDWDPID